MVDKNTQSILLFEDDADLAMQWKQAFSKAGFQVYRANTVENALSVLSQHHIDALICDMFIIEDNENVSNQGGITLLHQLHDTPISVSKSSDLDILKIAVSGCSDLISHTLRRICKNMGCQEFLLKPILPNELVEIVQKHLQKP